MHSFLLSPIHPLRREGIVTELSEPNFCWPCTPAMIRAPQILVWLTSHLYCVNNSPPAPSPLDILRGLTGEAIFCITHWDMEELRGDTFLIFLSTSKPTAQTEIKYYPFLSYQSISASERGVDIIGGKETLHCSLRKKRHSGRDSSYFLYPLNYIQMRNDFPFPLAFHESARDLKKEKGLISIALILENTSRSPLSMNGLSRNF